MEEIAKVLYHLVVVLSAGIIFWDARRSRSRIDAVVAAIAFGSILGAFVSAAISIFGG